MTLLLSRALGGDIEIYMDGLRDLYYNVLCLLVSNLVGREPPPPFSSSSFSFSSSLLRLIPFYSPPLPKTTQYNTLHAKNMNPNINQSPKPHLPEQERLHLAPFLSFHSILAPINPFPSSILRYPSPTMSCLLQFTCGRNGTRIESRVEAKM